METQIGLQILGNTCQVVSTVLAIYIAVFCFTLGYLFNNKKYRKKTDGNKFRINLFIGLVTIMLLFVNYKFIYPSYELGLFTYLPMVFIVATILISLYCFNKFNRYSYLENATIFLSSIFALFSFVIGFYIIMSCISSSLSINQLYDNYIFMLVKLARLFFVAVLNSLIYLVSFILIHKRFILKD